MWRIRVHQDSKQFTLTFTTRTSPTVYTSPAPTVRQKTTRAECSGVVRSGIEYDDTGKSGDDIEDA